MQKTVPEKRKKSKPKNDLTFENLDNIIVNDSENSDDDYNKGIQVRKSPRKSKCVGKKSSLSQNRKSPRKSTPVTPTTSAVSYLEKPFAKKKLLGSPRCHQLTLHHHVCPGNWQATKTQVCI